jgi:cyclase
MHSIFTSKLPASALCAIALMAMAAAEERPAKGVDQTLTVQLAKTGLYLISGGGGNSLLRLSANGFILVDGKLPGNYEAILALAKKVSYSEQPIRALILTAHYPDRTGTNARFLEDGAQIIAQENLKHNMAVPPTITYDHEYTLRMGGVEARLMHFGNARTNGDTVVYFPNLKVVAVGDLLTPKPDPDYSAGGSLVGWGPVLAQILKLDFDGVVPSKGPAVSRAGLEAFKNKIDTLVSRATELVKKGVPKDELMAKLKTDDLGWKLSFTPDQVDGFYTELSQTKQPAVEARR